MNGEYSRTEKESHLDTIHYELTMLNFCGAQLELLSPAGDRASFNVFLECFLLHYRNTMEFLSGSHHRNARKQGETSDLSAADPKPWAGRELSLDEVASFQTQAKKINDKYFDDISQYLQHCTERRFAEDKFWNFRGMYAELKPALQAFLQRFPPRHIWKSEVATLGDANSTATITYSEWNPITSPSE
jgi:hypothetical protein